MRRGVKRDVVMFRFGPEERHLPAAPIGNAKPQGFCVERGDPLQIRCVVYNVADRPRLDAFLSPSVGMIRNVCGKFDTAALRIDESQAESSARLFERARVLDDPHTRLFQERCCANHSIFAAQRISDVMQSASVAAMKAEDEVLRRGASKEDRVAIGFYFLKAPDLGVERGVI